MSDKTLKTYCLFSAFLMMFGLFWSPTAYTEEKTSLILVTTGTSRSGVRVADNKLVQNRPGWFVELSRKAGEQCGAIVKFDFMPWARALNMVKRGVVSAAFNSSYKDKRAEYAVYPRKGNELDEARASRNYAYYAYLQNNPTTVMKHGDVSFSDKIVLAERSSSIISHLKKNGAKIQESADFKTMLRMVAGGRAYAAVAIGHDIDGLLADNPDLAARITKIKRPVVKKVGYVMFSKIFYAKHRKLVECFWTKSAELRQTDWFKTTQARYQ